nr:hypothetical protein [Tanacetum cinerariifolium]
MKRSGFNLQQESSKKQKVDEQTEEEVEAQADTDQEDSKIKKEVMKRSGFNLQQESSKKQKVDEQTEEEVEAQADTDQEVEEMKLYVKIVPDKDISIDAIPLATKPSVIVEYKIVKEGKIRDDLIACLNKAMAFLIAVASSRQGLLNATTIKVKDIWLGNALSLSDQGMQYDPGVLDGQAVQTIILNNAAFKTEDLDTYDSECDDVSNTKVLLMANISNYGSDVILE